MAGETAMSDITRRTILMAGVGGGAVLTAPGRERGTARAADIVVVGAGVFGAWTATHLQRAGRKVTLVDAWGPAHSRASSGGESRMTRATYGPDAIYARMARDSLAEWKALSALAELPVFHRSGVLFFFGQEEPYAVQALEVHRALGLPTERLSPAELRRRFPQMAWDGVALGLYEPDFGALMARRAVQMLVAEFVTAGGRYAQAAIAPPEGSGDRLTGIRSSGGETLSAEQYVFACGPWLPKLFPDVLGRRIFPTRQEVFFFAPEAGDDRFSPERLPGWADFNRGDVFYGFPDLEGRGFKIAHDAHGVAVDPDRNDRNYTPEALAEVRAYMRRRFPALADRPLAEARVCQYENSANGDFLIDRHPRWSNALLVGGGSGHGFKHGPAVGHYAASLLTGTLARPEPRFSL
jgi:glycine/D-amino acid oxidase-like deaminating enzyme